METLERDNQTLGKVLVAQIRWALSAETTNRNKVVLTALILHSDRFNMDSWASLKKLSQVTGLTESSVSKSLTDLEKDSLIIKRRHWKKNVYDLQCPFESYDCE